MLVLMNKDVTKEQIERVKQWDIVMPMAQAAVVAGANGLMIEVHQDPQAALTDGFQSLKPEKFRVLLNRVQELAAFVQRMAHCTEKSESLH
ncbi:MAG: 3-deoxy-D-arabinoheptulosonate-7-phosphate synthase [Bacteroidetes bacterium]|nr:3-deoxy-D-arabinoheptulosonate-7-phosphate synthase [Bacteroidota bacterium]